MENELEEIVAKMVASGESEDNIALVIQNYDSVKKKDDSTLQSEDSRLDTSPQENTPSLELQQTRAEQVVPKIPVEEKKSYLSNLYTNLKAGANDFNKMLASIPETVYDIFALPQNAVAYATGADITASSKKFKETFGVSNPLLDSYVEEGKRIELEVETFNKNYESSSVSENIKLGNYGDAFELLGSAITRSAPISISMMVGGATMSAGKLSAIATPAFAGPERLALDEENPEASELANTMKSLGLGAAESVFSSIGTGTIGKVYKDVIIKEGAENGAKVFQRGLISMYEKALKDYGVPAGALGEGLEEVATQITQNMINEKDPMEGVLDAFIIGVGSGSVMSSPITVAKAKEKLTESLNNRSKKRAVPTEKRNQLEAIENDIRTIDSDLKSDIPQNIKDELEIVKSELLNSKENLINSEFDRIQKIPEGARQKLNIAKEEYNEIKENPNISETAKKILLSKKVQEAKAAIETQGIAEGNSDINTTNEFAEKLGTVEDISNIIAGATKVKVGQSDVILENKGENIRITSISTPQSERGTGSARNALQKLNQTADQAGKTVELNVVPLNEETSAEGLVEFYESEGFVKEQNFDLDGGRMVRFPKTGNIFNPVESEGESISRLKENIANGQTIEKVAKEHTESYLNYLESQGVDNDILQSDFVENYQSEIIEAIQSDRNFDPNQERIAENGSRLNENNEIIPEAQFLEEQGKLSQDDTFSGIDSIIEEENTQEEFLSSVEVSTNQNEYTVESVNGELSITPKFGNGNITNAERKKVVDQYLETNNFNAGKRADFSNKGLLEGSQISDVILRESENPTEIAQEILNIRDANTSNEQSIQDSKIGAIARALEGVKVDKESFGIVDDPNNIKDVNPFYFSSRSKTKTGNDGLIDNIREVASQFTQEEVSMQDVTDFIKEYRNPNDISENQIDDSFDLREKFKSITGIEATNEVLEKITGKQPSQEIETNENTEDSEVPFQTESNQETISGRQLRGLVDRLKKTGLAKDVKIWSNNQIQSFLEKLGISVDGLKKQQEHLSETDQIKEKAIEDGTFMKAPNGNKTNLSEKQWLETRTTNFKQWFGDWLTDPENSSKVIDENGEPLVVYHGGIDQITTFDEDFGGETTANNDYGAFYFSNEYDVSEDYSRQAIKRRYENRDLQDLIANGLSEEDANAIVQGDTDLEIYAEENLNVTQVFLNIRNPLVDSSQSGGGLDTQKTQRQLNFVKNKIDEDFEFQNDLEISYDEDDINDYRDEIEERARDNHSLEPDEKIEEYQFEEATREILEENGIEPEMQEFDGVLIENVIDDIGDASNMLQDEYIAVAPNQIKSATSNTGIYSSYNDDIRYQKEVSDSGVTETPNGFVYEGVVYLNTSKVKADTPIHEFGHLWNSYIKENNNEAYLKGLDLIKNSEYHNAVKNNPAYQNLTEEQQLEEALAQAIGEKGVKILNEAKKSKFTAWFRNLFTKIAKGLGLRSMSGKQLTDLTLEKFTDLSAAEILAGKSVTGQNTKAVKNKVDESETNSIDVLVAEQSAIKETRDKLNQKFRDSKFFVADIKKELVDYIKANIDSKRVSEIQKRELSKLLTSVRNAKTKNNLLKAYDQVNNIVTELDNRIIKRKIDKILGSRLSKKESGRRKANITDEQAEIVLNTIKQSINVPAKDRDTKIIELIDQRDQLLSLDELNESQELELQSIGISIDIISAITSNDPNKANGFLSESLEQIEEIYEEGRSNLKALREERKAQDKETISNLEQDANPKGTTTNKTVETLKKEASLSGNAVSRAVKKMTHDWFRGKLSGSLDSIAAYISRQGGDSRDSSPWVQFVNKLKKSETLKKARIRKFANKWKNSQKANFGSITRADKTLNRMVEIEVEVLPAEATERVSEKVNYSISQLLNVWQNYKNEKLRPGLAANGFTENVMSNIDDILSENVKQYGEDLIGLYDEMYQDANEVYKRMNFHSLGKPDFYAGKVHREGASIQEDTNALLGGVMQIGTTGYSSQKERVNNDKKINAVDTNVLFSRHLQESSHYVAFAEPHRIYNKILRSPDIQKAIILNNGINGEQILSTLLYYKVRDLEQGGERGNRIVDAIGRNVARSVLALKAKIGITQTISIMNGSFDMPKNIGAREIAENYNPVSIIKNVKFLMNNSDYMQNRYDLQGLESAVLGLENIVTDSTFKLNNSSLESKRKASSRFYKEAVNLMLANVKFGDMVGVLGATPVYSSWKSRYLKDGLSEQEASLKAIGKFEAAVDRSQQSISAFGKSEIQKHPYLRYIMMFATAPIQNFQNANYHRRELMKGLRGQEKKGTNTRNALAFLNYQFAQPMLYTYLSNILAGSAISAAKGLFDDEEEVSDADKALLSSAFAGNVQSIPFIGGVLLYTIDKVVLEKEHTFANVIGSPLYDEIGRIQNHVKLANSSKTEKTKKRHIYQAVKKTSGILLGIPNLAFDVFEDWDTVYNNEDVSTEAKTYRALGYSKIVIQKKTDEDLRDSSRGTKEKLTEEEIREGRRKKREQALKKRAERNIN